MSYSVAVDTQASRVCVIVCPIVIKVGMWVHFSRNPQVKVSKERTQQVLNSCAQADTHLRKEDNFPI